MDWIGWDCASSEHHLLLTRRNEANKMGNFNMKICGENFTVLARQTCVCTCVVYARVSV